MMNNCVCDKTNKKNTSPKGISDQNESDVTYKTEQRVLEL